MWTLTLWTFTIAVLVVILAVAVHYWLMNRRNVLGDSFTDLADTFWARIWAWLKMRWDLTVAAIIAAAPTVWSAGLDTVVIVANLMADVLPGVAGLDLSFLIMPDWLRAAIPIGAAVLPPMRAAFTKGT